MTLNLKQEDVTSAIKICAAVAEAIRELGEVPSGHLYARLMEFVDIHQYDAVINTLIRAQLVERKNHLLRWVGPPSLHETAQNSEAR